MNKSMEKVLNKTNIFSAQVDNIDTKIYFLITATVAQVGAAITNAMKQGQLQHNMSMQHPYQYLGFGMMNHSPNCVPQTQQRYMHMQNRMIHQINLPPHKTTNQSYNLSVITPYKQTQQRHEYNNNDLQ